MVTHHRRKPIALEPGQDPASLPLRHPPRELFAQAVARGVNVDQAYREAGYAGGPASRRELRCAADVDARIRWLLAERIRADAKARVRLIEKENDARLRLVRHLESIAYSDVRDVIQWDSEPTFDKDGNLVGSKAVMKVTPSHLLSKEQAAQVRAVTTKSGGLRFETADKMAALAQLGLNERNGRLIRIRKNCCLVRAIAENR